MDKNPASIAAMVLLVFVGLSVGTYAYAIEDSIAINGQTQAQSTMQFGGQYFMVLEKDGKVSVLPVPFDASTATIVESGQGFVETSALIESIKAESQANADGAAGGSSLDVWKNGSRQVKDSTPCMIALAVVGGICFVVYMTGIVVVAVRKRKIHKQSIPNKATQ